VEYIVNSGQEFLLFFIASDSTSNKVDRHPQSPYRDILDKVDLNVESRKCVGHVKISDCLGERLFLGRRYGVWTMFDVPDRHFGAFRMIS
jgi:hypothetical protein